MDIRLEAKFTNINASRYFPTTYAQRKSTAVIVLPGVLSRWNEQVEPIIDILARYGTVFGVNYTAKAWNARQIIADTAHFINHELRSYKKIVVLGVSIGGMITPDIVRAAKRDRGTISSIVVDAPYGVSTLKELPWFIHWAFQMGVYNVANSFGDKPLARGVKPPKDENIEVPEWVVDPAGIANYKAGVVAAAMAGLSGHKFQLWGSQTAYMARHRPHARLLADSNAVYMACVSSKNETVAQPKAVERWHQAVPNLKIIEVNTAHAAFREALPTWQPKIVEAFNALGMTTE